MNLEYVDEVLLQKLIELTQKPDGEAKEKLLKKLLLMIPQMMMMTAIILMV